MMNKLLLVLLMCIISKSVHADDCYTGTAAGIYNCDLLKQGDTKTPLNNSYKLLASGLSEEDMDKLTISQKLWLDFRVKHCEFEASSNPYSFAQTPYNYYYNTCINNLNKDRTKQLNAMRNVLIKNRRDYNKSN